MVHFENVGVSLVRLDPYLFFLPHVMYMDSRFYGYEALVKSIQFKHLRKFLVSIRKMFFLGFLISTLFELVPGVRP